MGLVFSSFTVSLDGFVADEHGEVGRLFDWYRSGPVEVRLRGYDLTFQMSEASAAYWRRNDTEGAFIAGRGIFDDAHGWGGKPPGNSPTIVVTHRPPPPGWPPIPDAPFTFVDNLDDALTVAAEMAGGGDINVAGVDIMRQCLDLGALQEIRVDVAAVLLHNGVRHLDGLQRRDISLAQIEIVEGAGVTHIRYAVSYGDIEEKSS